MPNCSTFYFGPVAAIGTANSIRAGPGLTLAAVSAAGAVAGFSASIARRLAVDPRFIARARPISLIARADGEFVVLARPATWVVSMFAQKDLPALAPAPETRPVTFDFGPQLAAGVTITSIMAINAFVALGSIGADPDPGPRIVGSPQIVASPYNNAAAQAVLQLVGNCVGDVDYLLQCQVATSDGATPTLEARLPCKSLPIAS